MNPLTACLTAVCIALAGSTARVSCINPTGSSLSSPSNRWYHPRGLPPQPRTCGGNSCFDNGSRVLLGGSAQLLRIISNIGLQHESTTPDTSREASQSHTHSHHIGPSSGASSLTTYTCRPAGCLYDANLSPKLSRAIGEAFCWRRWAVERADG